MFARQALKVDKLIWLWLAAYVALSVLWTEPASARSSSTNIDLPSSPQGSYNYDEVKTSSGVSCRQASGSSLIGEMGVVNSTQDETSGFTSDDSSNTAIYGRLTYAFGAPKRLDCNKLYEIELQTLRLELEMLRAEKAFAEME